MTRPSRDALPDHQPDQSGLDDGPPLPRHVLIYRRDAEIRRLRKDGLTLRYQRVR